jgi:CheY-like chemotaxis protein
VKYLVDAHGGTITAKSPGEGKGATFTVQLPLLQDGTNMPTAIAPSVPVDMDLEGIKVLAVDDNQDARELITTMLAQYGAKVQVVASGAEVLARLACFRPQVLVCDISMPELDGYSLLKQIRALPVEQGGRVPAIAVTAYAREEDRQQALRSGFQRHIAKPLGQEKLVTAILELVKQ